MRGWRAWYADGEVYTSYMATWAFLPDEGIVGVVEYLDPPYRNLMTSGDWYWLADGRIHRENMHPEWGQFVEPPEDVPAEMLKKSGAVTNNAWERVQREMMEARTWP